MGIRDVLNHNCQASVSVSWIEDYDYDLYQFIRKTYKNRHYSKILLSVDVVHNRLNVSFINRERNNSIFIESKSLDRLSFMLEEGLKELFVKKGETSEHLPNRSYAAI